MHVRPQKSERARKDVAYMHSHGHSHTSLSNSSHSQITESVVSFKCSAFLKLFVYIVVIQQHSDTVKAAETIKH